MLAGGIFLTIFAASFGELRDFDLANVLANAWASLGYLVVAGSHFGIYGLRMAAAS
jgi:hypothetical protein